MNWMWSTQAALWALCCCLLPVSQSAHILGVFVNVHRSQLLVHLAVARVLLQRGHQLTLVTSRELPAEWQRENITHILVPWELQLQSQQQFGANFILRMQSTLDALEQSGQLLLQPGWLEFMQAQPAQRYELLLLGYHFNDHLLGVAAHFKCPVAIISTQQPTGFVHSLMGNPEERWYVPQPYDSRQRRGLEAWLFGLWEKSMELLARRVMQRIYSAHFGSSRYPSFEHIRQRVALALNNHHSLSEGPIAPLLPSMLDIGGILLEQLPALELSAHPKRPFILFSLGTRYSWRSASGSALQQIFVHVFAQFPNYDIYWTYDGNNGSAISAAYAHIKLAKWWPQAQLLSLPHARLFITHGGKGSLTEALYFGHTPVLGLPFNGEQRANLGKAQAKGWALMFDKRQLTTDQLLCGMQRVLSERSFKQHIQTAARIYKDRPLNASQLTVYWLEYILRYKGALQLSGTARELPLYEFYLLDVRLFIYSMLIILIFMLFWLDKRSE